VSETGSTDRTAPLLVVLEPLDAANDAVDPQARQAFASEALRLAAVLGTSSHFVTWTADLEMDFGSVATKVVEVARAAEPHAILVQDGDPGRQLAPLIARSLGTAAVLSCSDVRVGGRPVTAGAESCPSNGGPEQGTLTFVKPVYGGWLEREIRAAAGFIPVATLDVAGIEILDEADAAAVEAIAATAEVLTCSGSLLPGARHIETIPPDARSVDLVHAKRIVAAGMGTANEKLLAAVRELADLLEGSVGATRPVVDEGLLPKERLIGQTGRTVAPDLYIALGISGSPHHVAGVRKADRVLSVNRDTRAPIFQFSDIGYVADLEAVLPALIAHIKEWRDVPAGGGDGR
jgi:electron transfer flavoprotein alpha subunit